MKLSLLTLLAIAVTALPSAALRSQVLAPAAADPLAALQTLQKTNADLLKRQAASLQDLVDMTSTAHEARIFSKRG